MTRRLLINAPTHFQHTAPRVIRYCGGSAQTCTEKKQCLPTCWSDCYPCYDEGTCDELVAFGLLAEKGQKCYSIYTGFGGDQATPSVGIAEPSASTPSSPSSSATSSDAASGETRRTVMYWLLASTVNKDPDTPARWAERLANVKAHAANITGVSPVMYTYTAGGGFGIEPTQYPTVAKYVPEYAALGLDIEPLIAADGGIGGLAALLRNPKPFIDAAVSAAVKNNYTGYNFDNELRGGASDSSWSYLKDYGKAWMVRRSLASHRIGPFRSTPASFPSLLLSLLSLLSPPSLL